MKSVHLLEMQNLASLSAFGGNLIVRFLIIMAEHAIGPCRYFLLSSPEPLGPHQWLMVEGGVTALKMLKNPAGHLFSDQSNTSFQTKMKKSECLDVGEAKVVFCAVSNMGS